MDDKLAKMPGILLFLVFFFFAGQGMAAAAVPAGAGQERMTKITAITQENAGGDWRVILRGNGAFLQHNAWIYTNPPKIVVEIPGTVPPFVSMVAKASHPAVESIRVGFHAETVRVVLDIKGRDIPMFRTAARGNDLIIALEAANVSAMSGMPSPSTPAGGSPENSQTTTESAAGGSTAADSGTSGARAAMPAANDLFDAEAHLVDWPGPGTPGTGPMLADGIEAYTAGNFSEAVTLLDGVVAAQAAAPEAERAVFLAAKAFERLHAEAVGSHYNAIKRRYEDAIYRYADSIYLSDAYYAVARLCFRSNMLAESLGYCNLVINMGKRELATLKAMLLKARVLSVTGRQQEALALYQQVYQQHPDLKEGVRAKIETAKTLFDLNRFDRSMALLASVAEERDNLARYPELSRYLGDNYYQLGHFSQAREHLFRAYNMAPSEADSHLILARIGDAYKEEGQTKAAEKVYRLVQERHPGTEGAMIGMYRLAELQENSVSASGENRTRTPAGREDKADKTREIYEEVVKKTAETEAASPLAEVALLKLAVLDYKEGRCIGSLTRLKHLLENYPTTSLRREINQTFEKALACVLEEDYRTEKYKRIVNTYQAQKRVIGRLTSPDVFMVVARSAAKLGLDTLATEMYTAADSHLYGQQKPADLLYHLALDAQAKKDPEAALLYADMLMSQHPGSSLAGETCLLKGDLLRAVDKDRQAAAMFDQAAERIQGDCRRATALLQASRAHFAAGSENEADARLRQAHAAVEGCERPEASMFEALGMLYMQYGFPEEALSAFQEALARDDAEAIAPRLKIMMARCHEMRADSESYLAIYNEVAVQEDPFWGKIAREKMAEFSFNQLLQKEK